MPSLTLNEKSCHELEHEYVLILPGGEAVQFATWEALRTHYREEARQMHTEVFAARFFIFVNPVWQEVHPPSFAN